MVSAETVRLIINQQTLLDNITFTVEKGECLGIAGPSGAGKSLLLKVLCGLVQTESGKVRLGDLNISGDMTSENRQKLGKISGIVFQQSTLMDDLSVWENIGLRELETGKQSEVLIYQDVSALAIKTGLHSADLNKKPYQLSGGMQKKVAISRAVFHKPEVVLYDEPTSGLDPGSAGMIDELIRELNLKSGITSLIVTHDLDTLRNVCQKVLYLSEGKIAFAGDVHDFFLEGNEETKKFIRRKI